MLCKVHYHICAAGASDTTTTGGGSSCTTEPVARPSAGADDRVVGAGRDMQVEFETSVAAREESGRRAKLAEVGRLSDFLSPCEPVRCRAKP